MKQLLDIIKRLITFGHADKGITFLRKDTLDVTPTGNIYSGFTVGAILPDTIVLEGTHPKNDGSIVIGDLISGQYLAVRFDKMTITGSTNASIHCIKA